MPLLPIDLQTMFSQMTQIGREQAVQKEVPPQYQAVQADQIVKKTEHDDKAVNQSREPGDGPEKVREDSPRRRRRGGAAKGDGSREQGPREKGEVFEDPALGHHVDLVG
jgi:hypothetical protein